MTSKPVQMKIPVSGNLGLLALGHKGVQAWRKVRDEAEREAEPDKTLNSFGHGLR